VLITELEFNSPHPRGRSVPGTLSLGNRLYRTSWPAILIRAGDKPLTRRLPRHRTTALAAVSP